MKKIIAIIVIIIMGSSLGIGIYRNNKLQKAYKTPYDIQMGKIVTVQLVNNKTVIIKGYALLDKDANFEKGNKVYVELTDDSVPSVLRHAYDVYEENGQMYVETEWGGSYPAELLPGKVIAVNY